MEKLNCSARFLLTFEREGRYDGHLKSLQADNVSQT